MRRILILMASFAVAAALIPAAAEAQQQEQEAPGTRVVTVTTFDVPFTERPKVFPFLRDYFIPGIQLHPKVLNFRVMIHNWGANAAQVVLVAEYADFADIESECGQPCEEYFKRNAPPEEGSPGREDFVERRDAFNKYYAHHRDEIYSTNMMTAKVEGEIVGRVGPPPAEAGGND